ncbi:MAG: hypothetical protein QOJ24_446 [Mycobacterium sp.]|nr:hypothetical protein [Mycobacterium sp.]
MTSSAPAPIGSELDGTAKPAEAPGGIVNRYSPAGQVGFVAAAIIPTIVLYIGFWLIPVPENPYVSAAELAVFCLLYGVYFVGIIRLVNRDPQRRALVSAAAIVTVLVDTAVSCAPELPMFYNIAATAVNIAYVAVTVAYVAVWGVARRQSRSWMFGLPFAAAVSWAAQFGLYQHPGRNYWWEPLTAFVGTFVVGCLICWGFDVLGRRLTSRGEAPGS